jgi:hypothetical protein
MLVAMNFSLIAEHRTRWENFQGCVRQVSFARLLSRGGIVRSVAHTSTHPEQEELRRAILRKSCAGLCKTGAALSPSVDPERERERRAATKHAT